MNFKEIDSDKLYKKIMAMLVARDKTLKGMADEVGVPRSTLYTMNRGQPTLNTVFKMAQYLGCTVSHLIGEDSEGGITTPVFLKQFSNLSDEGKEEVIKYIGYVYYKEYSLRDKLYPSVPYDVFGLNCTNEVAAEQPIEEQQTPPEEEASDDRD